MVAAMLEEPIPEISPEVIDEIPLMNDIPSTEEVPAEISEDLQITEEIQVEIPEAAAAIEEVEAAVPEGVINEIREDVQEGMSEEVKEESMVVNEVEQEDKGEDMAMDNQPMVATDETAVITEGMTIVGDITSGGSLELLGAVTGNIDILGKLNVTGAIQGNSKAAEIFAEGARINGEINSQGSVKIGQSSVIIGNIYANSAVIAGAVKGDIDIHGPVVLDTSAIVMGNIKSKSVQINNGAVIEGMCSQCYAEVNPTSFFEEIKKKKDNKSK
ncbi:MAG: polymer-forming cytoskeletal protein [Lachnospiraceae bacterium]|nr:polymer-forming cytoskeletal protein [Lachnospiraceae bacterium]